MSIMATKNIVVKSWEELSNCVKTIGYKPIDYINGQTNAHSTLRLHGKYTEADVRVTLFRDHHAWCPYCQKIWLFLEEKQIPYRVNKITMFCYGKKEPWFTKYVVPRGMLPAILVSTPTKNGSIKEEVIAESDVILAKLESMYGKLGPKPLNDPDVTINRKLERKLFSAWCQWLCYPSHGEYEKMAAMNFIKAAKDVERRIGQTQGPYLLEEFGVSDTIIAPYIERMHASLYYYKGYDIRKNHSKIDQWFSAMESRSCYRGSKSDFHTHCHDLPPQMGGCYFPGGHEAYNKKDIPKEVLWVDYGWSKNSSKPIKQSWVNLLIEHELDQKSFPEPEYSRAEAAYRVLKHHETLRNVNPYDKEQFDLAMRATLTMLLLGKEESNEKDNYQFVVETNDGSEPLSKLAPDGASSLRYVKDRISIPRDMSIWAGARLRSALEETAQCISKKESFPSVNDYPIPIQHRNDVNPIPFIGESSKQLPKNLFSFAKERHH